MSDFSEISKLLRQLADAFDNLGSGAESSNGEIIISGEVTRDADCRAFNKKDGSVGHFTRINVKMPRPINDTLFANCIAWTDKFEYQFQHGDKVEFKGHFESAFFAIFLVYVLVKESVTLNALWIFFI